MGANDAWRRVFRVFKSCAVAGSAGGIPVDGFVVLDVEVGAALDVAALGGGVFGICALDGAFGCGVFVVPS